MLSYIHAEFYKVFRRKYTWLTLAVALGLEALLTAGWVFQTVNGYDVGFAGSASILTAMLGVGFAATLLTGDMVFAGQYKHNTLKNEVSYGLSRVRIYMGKLAVQTAMSVLFCVIMVGFYLALCAVTLSHDPVQDAKALWNIGYCMGAVFPLWVGVQGLTCSMYFLINSDLKAVCLSLGIYMVAPTVLEVMALLVGADNPVGSGLLKLYEHMPTVMAGAAAETPGDWALFGRAWIVGAIWLIAFTAIGLLGFQRKEIK